MRAAEKLGQEELSIASSHSSGGFLAGLSPDVLKAFEDIRLATAYPSGALLFLEGEAPQGVFVLTKGRVKLSLTSSSGRVMILRIVKPGEILGLHAVISNTAFQATAETVEPCQVSFVRREDFLRFLAAYPQAALLAAKQLSASYQETCEHLRSLGLSSSAREKVARFLLEWSDRSEFGQAGVRTRLTLTHEEIGQLIGASRETITRILGEFKERHWIVIRGSVLVLEDRAALEGVVGSEAMLMPGAGSLRPAKPAAEREPFRIPVTRPFVHAKTPTLRAAPVALRG